MSPLGTLGARGFFYLWDDEIRSEQHFSTMSEMTSRIQCTPLEALGLFNREVS